MAINIVCSDTYMDAFSRLDKRMQKKSFETIRLMKRSLRSDSLKIEKLNTKLDFKSARVTQDFRVIFTQSGNTILLVYIDHHENAYLWARRQLQGFDTADAKGACEYFEQSKQAFEPLPDESNSSSRGKHVGEFPERKERATKSDTLFKESVRPVYDDDVERTSDNSAPTYEEKLVPELLIKIIFAIMFFLVGGIVGFILGMAMG